MRINMQLYQILMEPDRDQKSKPKSMPRALEPVPEVENTETAIAQKIMLALVLASCRSFLEGANSWDFSSFNFFRIKEGLFSNQTDIFMIEKKIRYKWWKESTKDKGRVDTWFDV